VSIVRAHVRVSGRVQGVGFRYSTQHVAREAGLGGWVRNLRGGGVEAVFEGEQADVDRVVEWCRHGPPGARVENVDLEWETPSVEREFSILTSVDI